MINQKYAYAILQLNTITLNCWKELLQKYKDAGVGNISLDWSFENQTCAINGSHFNLYYYDKKLRDSQIKGDYFQAINMGNFSDQDFGSEIGNDLVTEVKITRQNDKLAAKIEITKQSEDYKDFEITVTLGEDFESIAVFPEARLQNLIVKWADGSIAYEAHETKKNPYKCYINTRAFNTITREIAIE